MNDARPGPALLVSLVREDARGRPGLARDAALAAAHDDPANAAVHLLDAVYASLVSGEARLALDLLNTIVTGGEPLLERRVRACRVWAVQLDRNWYPGRVGAELADDAVEAMPTLDDLLPGDPETCYLEATVARGPVCLLNGLALLDGCRGAGPAAEQIALMFDQRLVEYINIAQQTAVVPAAVWALCSRADLAFRIGRVDVAQPVIGQARQIYGQLGDLVGLARTYLWEGDWYATPGSSPEALGLELAPHMGPSPVAGLQDDERARLAYAQAAELIAGHDEPRLLSAIALRQALLATRRGRPDEALPLLADAGRWAAAAGDTAAVHLATMHELLAEIAVGQIAATRRRAGAGWSLDARGPVAEILHWALARGSASYATGLGRLAHRTGDLWRDAGDFERAGAAYSLAVALIGASGAIAPAHVLGAIADVDASRGFAARAVVRLEQAYDHLPALPDAATSPVRWLEHLDLAMSICRTQMNRVTSSPTRGGLRGLERILSRLQQLAARANVSLPEGTTPTMRDRERALATFAGEVASKDLTQRIADSQRSDDVLSAPFLAQAFPALASQIVTTDVVLALSRARVALATGWTREADDWFASSLAAAVAAGPAQEWLGVIILGAQGRTTEAQTLLKKVRASGYLTDDLVASLALRARDFPLAGQLFAQLDNGTDPSATAWPDLLDRAELALELGDPQRAIALASKGIDGFEDGIGRLTRDPDRVAMADDSKVPAIYLVAARACMAAAATDASQAPRWYARCLQLIDRPRSLSSVAQLSGRSVIDDEADRRWQQAATEWASRFDRLMASYGPDTDRDIDRSALSAELTEADDTVVSIEAELENAQDGLLTGSHLPPRLDVEALQRSLTPGACAVEYQVAGRELMSIVVTSTNIVVNYQRFERSVVEDLANRMWRACESGDAGDEADELSRILLEPFADVIASHERLVIAPVGPLSAVPFHVLPFQNAPLATTHVVSYVPTLALLALHQIDGPLHGDGVTVVGDPAFAGDAHVGLRRLPGAAVEARAIATTHAARDVLVGDEATEQAVRPLLPGRAIVHLAAHGRLDEVAPSTSSILLAGSDELTVADFIGMKIQAGLVVLSACDSGRGAATLGGDVVGLARGLGAAGVERAVVSLWPVDDVVACVTMQAFHERLKAGDAPALALATAQREMRGLTSAEVLGRYASIDGGTTGGARSHQRGGHGSNPARMGSRLLSEDPDFLEVPEENEIKGNDHSGNLARNWAPFVLVGT